MDRILFGRTGLEVSVAGLGCGGRSRLGQLQGGSVDDSVRIIHEALDLGINYIDTAQIYDTEDIVGQALVGRRDAAIVSTKFHPFPSQDEVADAQALRQGVEESLRKLRTDRIDVFHLHGVSTKIYEHCVSELLPELERQRDLGKIRFIAISEQFLVDFDHATLQQAVLDDYWDVMMVGFNILNPSARKTVLPEAIARNIGIEVMYAVRRALSNPQALTEAVQTLAGEGLISLDDIDVEHPLDFLIHDGGASSVVDAAYRFARHEPGSHVVLTGTGSVEHLRQNVASLNAGPLPKADRDRLAAIFGDVAALSGD